MQKDQRPVRRAELTNRAIKIVDSIAVDWIDRLGGALNELHKGGRPVDDPVTPALAPLPRQRGVQTDAIKPLSGIPRWRENGDRTPPSEQSFLEEICLICGIELKPARDSQGHRGMLPHPLTELRILL
jgi:hypothetical protein